MSGVKISWSKQSIFHIFLSTVFVFVLVGCSWDEDVVINANSTSPVVTVDSNFQEFSENNVTLNATAKDADGNTLTYLWEQIAGVNVNLLNSNKLTATFKAPSVVVDTLLSFRFTATDTTGNSDSGDVNVTVIPKNPAPVSLAGPDRQGITTTTLQSPTIGEIIFLDGSGSIGNVYTWAMIESPNNSSYQFSSSNTPVSGFYADTEGNYTIELTVGNGQGLEEKDRVTIRLIHDTDGDGIANKDDLDRDGDGFLNVNDLFPDSIASHYDDDNDSVSNYAQADEDGDGFLDFNDSYPFDANRSAYVIYVESKEAASTNANDGVSVAENAGSVPLKIQGTVNSGSGNPDLDYYKLTWGVGVYSVVLSDNNASFSPTVTVIGSNGVKLPSTERIYTDNNNITIVAVQVSTAGDYYLIVTDSNGMSDSSWSYDVEIFADQDMDGLSDDIEKAIDSNHFTPDSDGDGIGDFNEFLLAVEDWATNRDIDGDGIPNWWDQDSDNDNILDSIEFFSPADYPNKTAQELRELNNVDGDALPNYLDLDSDGNLFALDIDEVGINPSKPSDLDGNGIPDYLDLDNDGDGLSDIDEGIDNYNNALNLGAKVADSLIVGTITNTTLDAQNICREGDTLIVEAINLPAEFSKLSAIFNSLKTTISATPALTINNELNITCPQGLDVGLVEFYLSDGTRKSTSLQVDIKNILMPVITEITYNDVNKTATFTGVNLADDLTIVFDGVTTNYNNSVGIASQFTIDVPATAKSGFVRLSSGQGTSNSLWLSITTPVEILASSPSPQVDLKELDISTNPLEEMFLDGDGKANIGVDNLAYPQQVTAILERNISGDISYVSHLSAIYLPGDTNLTLDANTTATALIWSGLGVSSMVKSTDWAAALNGISQLPEVQAFALMLKSKLQSNPYVLADGDDELKVVNREALLAAAQWLQANLNSGVFSKNTIKPMGMFGEDATVTPLEVDDIKVYERDDTGNVNVENDTQLYLSVKMTTSNGVVQKHIKGLSGMAGPQGLALLYWASTSEYDNPKGSNALVEVVTPGIDTEFEPKILPYNQAHWQILFTRTLIERAVWPVVAEFLPMDGKDFVQIVYYNAPAVVDTIVTKAAAGDVTGSLKSIITIIIDDALSVPPGPITQAVAKKYGKHLVGAILKKVTAKVAAKFVPILGQLSLAVDVAGHVNNGLGAAKAVTDIVTTDAVIHYDVRFPLSIESVEPSKVKPTGKDFSFDIKGSGFSIIERGWVFKSYLKPSIEVVDADGLKVTITPSSISKDGTSMKMTIPGWYLDENTNGPLGLTIHHPTDNPDAKVTKDNAIEIVSDVEVSSISPDHGGQSIKATIYGAGFNSIASNNEVTIGGEATLITAATESSLSVVIPANLNEGEHAVYARASFDGQWSDWSVDDVTYTVEEGDVAITVCDNGGLKDDAFALYVNGSYQGTMYASNSNYCTTYNPILALGSHTAMLLGVEAPDSIGTYSISFTGVTNLQGSSRSGSDLTPGVRKNYTFDVTAASSSNIISNTSNNFIIYNDKMEVAE